MQSSVAVNRSSKATSSSYDQSRPPARSRHVALSMFGIASNIHELTGIRSGWNDAASYEPVKRRAAPCIPSARTTISVAA